MESLSLSFLLPPRERSQLSLASEVVDELLWADAPRDLADELEEDRARGSQAYSSRPFGEPDPREQLEPRRVAWSQQVRTRAACRTAIPRAAPRPRAPPPARSPTSRFPT